MEATYDPDHRRTGELAYMPWFHLPPQKRNRWMQNFLENVQTRKEKQFIRGVQVWCVWLLLDPEELIPKRVRTSIQAIWALRIALNELEGYGSGDINAARWKELKWVIEDREYLYEDKGYQSHLDEIAYAMAYIFDSKRIDHIDTNARDFWIAITETLSKKAHEENIIKTTKMAEKLLNCLNGEYPRCVRRAVKSRKKTEKEMARLYRKYPALRRYISP